MRCLAAAAIASIATFGCSGTSKQGPTGPTPSKPMTAKDIVQSSTPAIVRIESLERTGTGFILDKMGLVATNLHVVVGAADIKVTLHDGTPYKVTQIVGIDRGRDLALLRIAPQKPLPTLHLGDSDRMTAGDTIYTIGNPLGVFDYSVSNGLVSARREWCGPAEIAAKQCQQELTVLQISAPISQGSSGGPLFNQSGEVVGVTTAIIGGGAQAINLAVPTNYLKPMIAHPLQLAMAEFEEKTKELIEKHGDSPDDSPIPPRKIPDHPVALWDGCKKTDIEDTVKAISEAIEIGAPLYNQRTDKGFEACFRVYEGTSIKLEKDGACKGVRVAFGDGLLRATSIKSYRDKAWALRDTFDGVVKVAEKCVTSATPCPGAAATPAPAPAPAPKAKPAR